MYLLNKSVLLWHLRCWCKTADQRVYIVKHWHTKVQPEYPHTSVIFSHWKETRQFTMRVSQQIKIRIFRRSMMRKRKGGGGGVKMENLWNKKSPKWTVGQKQYTGVENNNNKAQPVASAASITPFQKRDSCVIGKVDYFLMNTHSNVQISSTHTFDAQPVRQLEYLTITQPNKRQQLVEPFH